MTEPTSGPPDGRTTAHPEEEAPAPKRPGRGRRILRRIGAFVVAPILIGILVVWVALSSETVAKQLIRRGLASAGDAVTIGRVDGELSGPLVLHDVTVRQPTFTAVLDSVYFDWTPIGLLRRQVRIDRLHVVGLHVTLPDSVPRDTAAPKRPELPIQVLLGDVRVEDLTVDAPGDVRLRGGVARATGEAEDYRAVARAMLSAPWLRDTVPIVAEGRGDLERVLVEHATADLLRGRVTAAGRVGWFPKTGWNLVARADGIEPGLMLADTTAWPGAITATLRTRGILDSVGPIADLELTSLGGRLRGQPLRGTAEADLVGTRLDIARSELGWGSARLAASGIVDTNALGVRYRLTVGDLRTALPDARGSLALTGTAHGRPQTPHVEATVRGRDVAYGGNRVARLEGRLDVDLAEDGRTEVDLTGDAARVGAQTIDRIVLAMRGTQRSHTIRADARAALGTAELALAGGLPDGLQGQRWSGELESLTLATRQAGTWRLQQAAPLHLAATSAALGRSCLAGMEQARLCAEGAWGGGLTWRVASTLERVPLALVDSLLPDTVAVPTTADARTPEERERARADSILIVNRGILGTLDARIDLQSDGGRLAGTALARTNDAEFYYLKEPGDTAPQRVRLDSVTLALRAGGEGVRADLGVRALEGDSAVLGAFTGTVTLPRYTRLGQALATQPFTLHAEGRLERLSVAQAFVPQLDSIRGTASLTADASGTVERPRIEGELRLDSIAAFFPGARAARGTIATTVTAEVGPGRRLDAALAVVPRGVLYDYLLDTVPARVAVDSGGIEVRVAPTGLLARLALGLSNPGVEGTVGGPRVATVEAELALPQYTRVGQALGPLPLRLASRAEVPDLGFLRIFPLPFDSLAGRLTMTADVEGTVAAPRATLATRLERGAARLPQGSLVAGDLDGRLEAAVARDSSLTADLRLLPRGMTLVWGEQAAARRVLIDSAALALRVTPAEGVRGALDLRLANAAGGAGAASPVGTVTGRLAIPDYGRLNQALAPLPLTATLDGRLDDLRFVEALAQQLDSVSGRMTLDVRVAGTVGAPRLDGGMRVENGAARVPLLGILLEDVQLAARGDTAGALALEGRVRSGPGTLAIGGSSPLAPTFERPGRIRLRGEQFQAANTEDLQALVSPSLDVTLVGDSTDIRGTVTIPFAHLALAELPQTAVRPSQDVVFVDDTAAQKAPQRFVADLRVVLGDSVSIDAFDFAAELGGQLHIVQLPEEPARASGEIVIEEGRYEAYGQDLTVTQGVIRFAGGPVDNPALDIRAARTAEDSVVAGLQIAGTVKSPQVTIFSDPPMSQNRALEYIVLGHPRGQGTTSSGSLVDKAVSELGLQGGNLIAGTLGRGIGLDEARIESEGDLSEASFVAGSYLSPHLYVSYGVGLFDAINRLRLRYEVTDNLTLQAEQGDETGADLFFSIERGLEQPAPAAGAGAQPREEGAKRED